MGTVELSQPGEVCHTRGHEGGTLSDDEALPLTDPQLCDGTGQGHRISRATQ